MAAPLRTPRTSWVQEGLRALGIGGPDAVRVEKLAEALVRLGRADPESTSGCCVSVPPLTASGCRNESARPQGGSPGLRRATASPAKRRSIQSTACRPSQQRCGRGRRRLLRQHEQQPGRACRKVRIESAASVSATPAAAGKQDRDPVTHDAGHDDDTVGCATGETQGSSGHRMTSPSSVVCAHCGFAQHGAAHG